MKERKRSKCFLMYCDDTLGLARTKAEAWAQLNEFMSVSERYGLVVKASMVVAPIAHLEHHGKKKRRRQRGRGRKAD